MTAERGNSGPESSRFTGFGVAVLAAGLVFTGVAGRTAAEDPPEGAVIEADSLYIVDCLLPGQLRRLGNRTYMTPKRPIRTTARDCNVRGGEYTAYDRANHATALKVWLPAAERGEVEAMNTVGEIFEQGLGTEPNYTVARFWYEKAAVEGYSPAQVNLARMYDAGLGVERDPITALAWYRKAWGIPEEERLLSEAEVAVQVEEAESKAAAVAAENRELAALLEKAQTEQASAEAEARTAAQIAARAKAEASDATQRAEAAESAIDSLLVDGALAATASGPSERPEVRILRDGVAKEVTRNGRSFGRYFALVIGNNSHQHLRDLRSPLGDAARIATLLEERYGFATIRIENADNIAVLTVLNELHEQLGPDDNLLIYYAGYGNQRVSGNYEVGYWLPVNAEQPPVDTYWLPVEQIGAHLARMPAKRVLVVADSSFAGLLADTPGFFLGVSPDLFRTDRYIELRIDNRSRLLLASGRDVPAESEQTPGSVFAAAFIDALEANEWVLPAPALYQALQASLSEGPLPIAPQFKSIKRAGDAVGDFYFVPNS